MIREFSTMEEKEAAIMEGLGHETILAEILAYLDNDVKEEVFDAIITDYDLDYIGED